MPRPGVDRNRPALEPHSEVTPPGTPLAVWLADRHAEVDASLASHGAFLLRGTAPANAGDLAAAMSAVDGEVFPYHSSTSRRRDLSRPRRDFR